ncbi:hypothetical protein D3870_09805 [Noviherbaspirillum cavernae]|uniref:Uncharacterized protein n=1 Tax=Noviherbaspirillum cavernae TaxID=2320862 RepID=A0A418X1E4_9BURK|nr:hypothetical protein [Noviherbaspirillum cavernae]RJG06267.1 hypothetical protein D3870_09805 [Noviherbaspirillum cavernae]
MPVIQPDAFSAAGAVKVRAKAVDPLEGLSGHAYVAARKLNQPVPRLDAADPAKEAAARDIIATVKRHPPSNAVFLSGDSDYLPNPDRRFFAVSLRRSK